MNTAKTQLMVSYQWDSQEQVLEIARALKHLGFQIWIDVEKMSGDIFDKMAEAVEGSTVVLICMTSKYEKSANCKRELNYAVEKKKKLIPIYLEKDYVAGGSLGLIMAGKLYFDFTDGNNFKENIENLKKEIENQMRVQEDGVSVKVKEPMEMHGQMVAVDDLKTKYKKLLEKHPIHATDNKGRIVLKEVRINEFAVKLKISHDMPPKDTFRDETRQYFENMKCCSRDDVDLSQLIDNDNRVTFIRGIAGMGKSVLAKQLTYGWANDDMYTDFKLCLMFECRDVNCFVENEGANLKKHEQFGAFLKKRFNYDLGDGEGILFIIDGLDELNDIHTGDSIIARLLNRKVCGTSKVIITGRPHIESKLEEYDEMGGLLKVEIQGLSNEQIHEYVDKFPSPQGVLVDLNNAKDSSKMFFPIVHIPQFLNTFCCLAILLKGEAIRTTAELYSWTLYLLLKQHADKHGSKEKQISDIFSDFSRELLNLGKVCHKLLNENKIILLQKDVESLLCDNEEKGKAFAESFFVDVSDNYEKKFQFKHVTLMEFLSAIHICSSKNRMDIIKEILQKNFIETVIFTCQLVGGLKSSRIVNEMLVHTAKVEAISEQNFLSDVLRLLQDCTLDKKTKFKRSLDIIMCFLNKYTNSKKFMISCVKRLSCDGLYLNVEDSRKLSDIKDHLVSVCHCNERELRVAFENVRLRFFNANELEAVQVAKYLGDVYAIRLNDMKINLTAVQSEIESTMQGGTCKKLTIGNCELEDDGVQEKALDFKLDVLEIERCKLMNGESFINAIQIGTLSCGWFLLRYLNIDHKLWWKLVEAIEEEERKTNGSLQLKVLYIDKCTPDITSEMKTRIMQCGVSVNGSPLPISPVPMNLPRSAPLSSSGNGSSNLPMKPGRNRHCTLI